MLSLASFHTCTSVHTITVDLQLLLSFLFEDQDKHLHSKQCFQERKTYQSCSYRRKKGVKLWDFHGRLLSTCADMPVSSSHFCLASVR